MDPTYRHLGTLDWPEVDPLVFAAVAAGAVRLIRRHRSRQMAVLLQRRAQRTRQRLRGSVAAARSQRPLAAASASVTRNTTACHHVLIHARQRHYVTYMTSSIIALQGMYL